MHRRKKVYEYNGTHWSVVEAVPGIYYYEAEKEVANETEIQNADQEIREEANKLGLPIFTSEDYKTFIKMLGQKVNKYIEW